MNRAAATTVAPDATAPGRHRRAAAPAGAPHRLGVPTEHGLLVLEADDDAVIRLYLPGTLPEGGAIETAGPPAHLAAAGAQLREYLAGTRRSFDLPLAPSGTAFQQEVWFALADIPYGTTISYAELAVRVGRPAAYRAVGQANGANPLPIVLPCHRVVASGGGIGGYGGGLPLKRWLLEQEGAAVTPGRPG